MRIFTLIVSTIFVAIGIWMLVDGDMTGFWVGGFFGICLLVAVFEPTLSKLTRPPPYVLVITEDEIACEHKQRARESIRWNDVDKIWYVTTSRGPWSPDEWILLEGRDRGCSFPTEAEGMSAFWDELEKRFEGFNYAPIIEGGTSHAKHLCWERK